VSQLTVTIITHKVILDPEAEVFNITVEHPAKGVWTETLRTQGEVNVFLKGLRCAVSFSDPELSITIEEAQGGPLKPEAVDA
jgi:hypothetical protein